MKYLITIISLILISHCTTAQRTYDTTFATGDVSNPIMRAIITLPAWYLNNISTDSGQAIIYSGGLGETGTDSSKVATYGPHNWMRTQGWDGGVTISGVEHFPIIISTQSPAGFWVANNYAHVIDLILANFRIKHNSVHLLGISMGGWEWAQVIAYRASIGDSTFLKYARSVVDIEGVKPDDGDGVAAAYPLKFQPTARQGIKFWFFEQNNDFRDGQTIVNTMNAINPGIAFWQGTSYHLGEHGQWQHEMGGNGQAIPDSYSFNGSVTETVYQWMIRNGDTVNDLHSITGIPPICNAGAPQQIQLLTTFATLTGTASAPSSSLTSTTWSIAVDPSGTATLSSPSTLSCGVSNMNIWGNYVFRLIAVAANGLKDTSYTRINVLPQCNTNTPVRYNLSGSGGEIFMPNGRAQPWRGKDTLVLPATGAAVNIIFGGSGSNGLSGDPCNPLIIMGPDAGQCFTNILRFDDHCQYIKIINNPRNPNPYSILVNTMGMSLGNHFEISGIDINGQAIAGQGATGVICKRHIDTLSNGAIVPETMYPTYEMTSYHFHHMRIRHTDGEGMYIGPTAPNGGDEQGPNGFFPVRLDSVEIDHMILDSTGWDGIQLSAGLFGCSIHDNIITHFGWQNVGSQQAGIIMGGTTIGDVYNNTVINGTGNGIQIFSSGTTFVYNNIVDSAGMDLGIFGDPQGQQSIFQNDIPSTVQVLPPQKVYYHDNFIRHPQLAGAIVSNNDRGTSLTDSIYNNQFCIPGANITTYQSIYIKTLPTAVFSNNTLITSCGFIPPTVSAGSNQTITLPTNSTTLVGTATGNGGATISTHTWTQVSGPNSAVILTPSNTTTIVSGLIQGVYTFQLSATDNNSNTSINSMTVTVNPIIAPPTERNYFIMHEYYHKRFQ